LRTSAATSTVGTRPRPTHWRPAAKSSSSTPRASALDRRAEAFGRRDSPGDIAFLNALGLREIDLLSFSLGGFVAQEISLIRPWSVRRLILVGTGPRGAPGMYGLPAEIEEHARHDESSADDLLHMHIFSAHTQTSQAKGKEFLARSTRRSDDRDPTPTPSAMCAPARSSASPRRPARDQWPCCYCINT
jgi:pimeloyl-ACP methyl ester carboxylesterase